MKVDLNRKFKDFKGLETENVISDKVAEALYSAGVTPEFAIKREDKFRAYKLCKSIMDNNGAIELSSEDIIHNRFAELLHFLYGGSLWSNP